MQTIKLMIVMARIAEDWTRSPSCEKKMKYNVYK